MNAILQGSLGCAVVWLGVALGLNTQAAETAPNFTLHIEPSTVTLIPGKSAAFLVSAAPLNGFDQPVQLSVTGLPEGVSSYFSPNPITPPGRSLLTLNATAEAALGSFRLDVSAVGGGITNATSSSATVNFGLIPLCYGTVKGTVTDAETGLPIKDAQITGLSATYLTDAAGMFSVTNVPLSADNVPRQYYVGALASGYWQGNGGYVWAVCGSVSEVEISLIPKRYASLSGTVTDSLGVPLHDVSLIISGSDNRVMRTETNGAYALPNLSIGYTNAPGTYYIDARLSGFWNKSLSAIGYAGSNTVTDFKLISICRGIGVTGSVLYADSELPAEGANVYLSSPQGSYSARVNAEGQYQFTNDNLTLGYENAAATYSLSASAENYYNTNAQMTVAICDQTYGAPLMRLSPRPQVKDNFASLTGQVLDEETGEPIPNAHVNGSVFADLQGFYSVTNINLGQASSNQFGVYANHNQFWSFSTSVWIYASQVSTQDLRLLAKRYGHFTGTVRDADTGESLSNVNVNFNGGGSVRTDEAGRYLSPILTLSYTNGPANYSVNADRSGYWNSSAPGTAMANQTNVVDLEMVKICSGANVFGKVVNAVTQEPIADARVEGGGKSVRTDEMGLFALRDLALGYKNAPYSVYLRASAAGFNDQTKTITIFCGANIVTEFGRPQTVFGAIEGYVTNEITSLPLAKVFVGSSFGAATTTDTNGFYAFTQVPLGLDAADMSWEISARPDGLPAQTKPVLVSSNVTSRLDFGFGAPNTDLAVSLALASDAPKAGEDLVYTITLRNNGGDAENVRLENVLPPSVIFKSASVTSGGFTDPVFTNGTVVTSKAKFVASSTATVLVVAASTRVGTLTNQVSVVTDTTDTNPGNDSASLVATLAAPDGGGTPGIDAGALTFNPQTGLFEQTVTVTVAEASAGVELAISGVTAAQLRNASGTRDGTPFVQWAAPVSAGGSVQFLLEYYLPNRSTDGFVPQFTLAEVTPLPPPSIVGEVLALDRDALQVDGRFLIEFASTPGRAYLVQYSSDMSAWQSAGAPVVAAGTRVQWYDDGPPKTVSKPAQLGSRFYRIILLP